MPSSPFKVGDVVTIDLRDSVGSTVFTGEAIALVEITLWSGTGETSLCRIKTLTKGNGHLPSKFTAYFASRPEYIQWMDRVCNVGEEFYIGKDKIKGLAKPRLVEKLSDRTHNRKLFTVQTKVYKVHGNPASSL